MTFIQNSRQKAYFGRCLFINTHTNYSLARFLYSYAVELRVCNGEMQMIFPSIS